MMDILFMRTMSIVAGMLLLTAAGAYASKKFTIKLGGLMYFILSIGLLVVLSFFGDMFPLNLVLVSIFSVIVGFGMGPAVEQMGEQYQLRKFLKSKQFTLEKGAKVPDALMREFNAGFDRKEYQNQWNTIILQAVAATGFATLLTGGVVAFTDIDFDFLGIFLFVALTMLVILGLLNLFIFKSRVLSLARAYFGALLFTLYLLYDFNRLEQFAGDETWGTAVHIAVSIYLDIINLFLDILQILANSD